MLNFCDFIQVYVFTTNHHLIYNTLLSAKNNPQNVKMAFVGLF